MTRETQAIEVEIVEINEVSPHSISGSIDDEAASRRPRDWGNIRCKIRKFDKRWWPLWAIVGVIAFLLLLAGGLLFGIVILVLRFVRELLRVICR